jgi:hypothetical protein
MKKVILLVIVALVAFSNNLSANNKIEQDMIVELSTSGNKLQGVVLDKLTHESLAGVVVSVAGQKVYTDFDGNFTVNNISKGKYEVRVSMISYQDQVITIDPNKQKSLEIQLSQR